MSSFLNIVFAVVPSLIIHAQTPPPKSTGGVVLHLALVKSMREHINFEIAQSRLRQANGDRRIITLVRERTVETDSRLREEAVQDIDLELRSRLTGLGQPVELAYVQMTDLSWMKDTFAQMDSDVVDPIRSNPVLALKGHLAPHAKLVFVGHSFLESDPTRAAADSRRLLEYLGAPEGTLIAQVSPTILPYEARDFAKSPGRRLTASAIKGFGGAALLQLGFDGLGWTDAITMPLVMGAAATLYHATLPSKATADTEAKPKPRLIRPFANLDDALFTLAIAGGTSAMVHGFFHVGASFLNGHFLQHGIEATGIFFAVSLIPKFLHNLHVAYVERTRTPNRVRLYPTVSDAMAAGQTWGEEIHSNDPRNFDCTRSLTL